MSEESVLLSDIAEAGVVAVLRASNPDLAVAAGETLLTAGIRHIEVTFTVPDAGAVISELVRRGSPGAVIGAGTLTRAAQVEQAVTAGARFLVAPGNDPTVTTTMVSTERLTMVGAFSPTEVDQVLKTGADIVKFFPGGFTGPSGIKALRGPFPCARFVPTGGVSTQNLAEWFAAGAFAVGAGSELAPTSAVEAGDQDEIARRAAAFYEAIRAVRSREAAIQTRIGSNQN